MVGAGPEEETLKETGTLGTSFILAGPSTTFSMEGDGESFW